MGNAASNDVLEFENDNEYVFVGRQTEINTIEKTLETADIVQVYGMTKIGKSRVLLQLLKQFHESRTCFYHDFNEDPITRDEDLIELISEFQNALVKEVGDKPGASKPPLHVSDAIKSMTKTLKACKERLNNPILFLDNLETAFNGKSNKDHMLSFLKAMCTVKGCKLKVVLTTSEKISMTDLKFGQVEIRVMSDTEIGEILETIITRKGMTNDGFDLAERILSPENQIYIDIIAKECEGLPLAAYMAAMELLADEGMLEPRDVVQLLFNQRVHSLSLEYYPQEERIDLYKQDIEKAKELGIYFFQTLNRNLDENNRQSIEDLRTEFTRDSHESKAKVDISKCFKLLTQPCIMRFLGKSRQLDMHGIFRECIREMTDSDTVDDEVFRSLLISNAKRYGMDLSEEEVDNPRLLEEYVHQLSDPDNSNEHEPFISQESGEKDVSTEFNIVEKVENKTAEDSNISAPSDNLYAETSESIGTETVCDKCNRMKRSTEHNDLDLASEQPLKKNNLDLININFCSCRPKMKDLKFANSVEDNTLIPVTTPSSSFGETQISVGQWNSNSGRTTVCTSALNQNAISFTANDQSAANFSQTESSSTVGQNAISYSVNRNDTNHDMQTGTTFSGVETLSPAKVNTMTKCTNACREKSTDHGITTVSSQGGYSSANGQQAMSYNVNVTVRGEITSDGGDIDSLKQCLSEERERSVSICDGD